MGEFVASAAALDGFASTALARPKSRTLTVPFLSHLDVRGFEIAVDDPLLVSRFEGVHNLFRNRERLVDRHTAAADQLREILAFDKFHDDGKCLSLLPFPPLLQPIDRGNVWMIEGREDFCFAPKSGQAIVISGNRCRQDLDGHLPFQLRIRRSIHFAHSAFAQLGHD